MTTSATIAVVLSPETGAYALVAFAAALSSGLVGIGGATVFQALWFLFSLLFPKVQFGSIAVAAGYFAVQGLVTQPVMISFTYKNIQWRVLLAMWPPMLVTIPVMMLVVLFEAPMEVLRVLLGVFLLAFALNQLCRDAYKQGCTAEPSGDQSSQEVSGHVAVPLSDPTSSDGVNTVELDEQSDEAEQMHQSNQVSIPDEVNGDAESEAAGLMVTEPPVSQTVLPELPAEPNRVRWPLAISLGLAAGITGGVFGLPGAPVIMYFSLVDYTASEIRATCQILLFAVSLEHVYVLWDHGEIVASDWPRYVINVCCGICGLAVGNHLHSKVDKAIARRFLNTLLVVTGSLMAGQRQALGTFAVAGVATCLVLLAFWLGRRQGALRSPDALQESATS